METISRAIVGTAIATLALAGQATAASLYSVTDLGPMLNVSINDSGRVIGSGFGNYLWENGTLTQIDNSYINTRIDINNQGQAVSGNIFWDQGQVINLSPNNQYRVAFGINDKGTIVGHESESIQSISRAFIMENGTTSYLDTLGGLVAGAADINNVGQIVGVASRNDGTHSAVLWENGKVIELTPGIRSRALDINEQGQVIGQYQNSSGEESAFLWEDGKFTDLGSLGGDVTWAWAINEVGQIVGASRNSEDSRAFLWDTGEMIDLNNLIEESSGWELIWANDINNQGQIVGWGRYNGLERGFLLTPTSNQSEPKDVPEPTVTLGLLALGILGVSTRQKRNHTEGD